MKSSWLEARQSRADEPSSLAQRLTPLRERKKGFEDQLSTLRLGDGKCSFSELKAMIKLGRTQSLTPDETLPPIASPPVQRPATCINNYKALIRTDAACKRIIRQKLRTDGQKVTRPQTVAEGAIPQRGVK